MGPLRVCEPAGGGDVLDRCVGAYGNAISGVTKSQSGEQTRTAKNPGLRLKARKKTERGN
jgi:hypothetical protein